MGAPHLICKSSGKRQARPGCATPERRRGRDATLPWSGVQAAKQKQDEKHDHNHAQNAAKTGAAVVPVRVIAAAAAKQDQNQHDYQQETHRISPFNITSLTRQTWDRRKLYFPAGHY
jgi:hypothetical protein